MRHDRHYFSLFNSGCKRARKLDIEEFRGFVHQFMFEKPWFRVTHWYILYCNNEILENA